MTEVTQKVERAIARFDRVTRQLDERGGPSREAARRERQRLNAGLGRVMVGAAAAAAVIWAAAAVIGFIQPLGMFGFLGVLLLSVAAAAMIIARGGHRAVAPPAPSADLPNRQMVERFDSYVYRVRPALPAPAQVQIDAISAILPSLKETLDRVDTLDPRAQDARRLMSIHLPGLVERYSHVPRGYRSEQDGEGKTVDERLVEGLAAARTALDEVSQGLARDDLAAFETQGRFIQSRYGSEGPEAPVPNKDGNGASVDS